VDYDAIAELYDSTPYRTKPVDPELLAFLRERPSAAGLTLIDIGCGTGNQLIANRAAVAPAQMVGVGRFVGMLGQAQTKAAQIAWVQADGSCMPPAALSLAAKHSAGDARLYAPKGKGYQGRSPD
jgi:ubiquinone/menaquinone biosynthesis C-methylase UbiE